MQFFYKSLFSICRFVLHVIVDVETKMSATDLNIGIEWIVEEIG